MSDLIVINGGAFNLAIQALKRAGKDEIAEQLEVDCECVPDLIEQLQQRNAELEKELADSKALQSHSNHIVKLKTKNAELAATVEQLRESLMYHAGVMDYLDKHTHPNIECDAVAHEMRENANATPQQSLNALKREAWIKGYKQTTEYYNGSNRSHDWIVRLANTKYPTEGDQ